MMTDANDAFYQWERRNNEQDLSDRDKFIWTAGWMESQRKGKQTMNKDEEFIKAYAKCVAVAPETAVREFISRYNEDHEELYQEFSEYYSSIMDALGIWEWGIKFAKEQA